MGMAWVSTERAPRAREGAEVGRTGGAASLTICRFLCRIPIAEDLSECPVCLRHHVCCRESGAGGTGLCKEAAEAASEVSGE